MASDTVRFTIAEAAAFLDPPMSEAEVRALVKLAWLEPGPPERRYGQVGRPGMTYAADALMRAHAAIINLRYPD